jgi:hypothetical protein
MRKRVWLMRLRVQGLQGCLLRRRSMRVSRRIGRSLLLMSLRRCEEDKVWLGEGTEIRYCKGILYPG